MNKEDTLPKEIENILVEIDFIEKYKEIWEKYDSDDENYIISYTEIKSVFKELGYIVSKVNKEQYFSDFFEEKEFLYRIGVSIKYNIVHFDISIINEKLNIKSGGSFGLFVQLMTNWEMSISSPGFYNLQSFKNLIQDLVLLFQKIQNKIEIRFI